MWPVELVKRPWLDQPCPGECGVGPPIASACTFGSLARTPETRLLPCDWQFSQEKRAPLTYLPTERPRLPANRTTLQSYGQKARFVGAIWTELLERQAFPGS